MSLFLIHVPKCAGKSVKAASPGAIHSGHATAMELWREYGADYLHGVSLAVVRHPIDRFLSAYSYLTQQTPDHEHWQEDTGQRAWVCRWPTVDALVLEGGPGVLDLFLFWPQVNWINAPITHVVQFENLAFDWDLLRGSCGLADLPRINGSNHGHWQDVVSQEAQAELRRWYADDFRMLGYK